MKCEVSEICGDWALEIFQYPAPRKPTIVFFNSRQNALNVKRILEVDGSIPNAATVCDMQEVVRRKDCKHLMFSDVYGECSQAHMGIVRPDDFCSYGERKDENDK